MCSNYLGIKLEPALGTLEDKIEHLSSYAHVVHTTAKQVISRRRKNENVFKMSKNEKCTCKACKNTIFHCQICKFVGFLLPSSSWLLKLPNSLLKRASFAQLTRATQKRRQHKQKRAGAGTLSVRRVDNFDNSDNAYSKSIPSLKDLIFS